MYLTFRTGILAALLGALCPAFAFGQDTTRIVILHTNDLRGRLLPRATGDGDSTGGVARLVGTIRALSENQSAIVVDAGDVFGPGRMSVWDAGRTMSAAMGRAGYAALTPGNHDFAVGREALIERQTEAGFPFLAANLRFPVGTPSAFESSTRRSVGGVEVGLVGLLSPELANSINQKNLDGAVFTDPVAVARKEAASLRAAGVDLVIALTHMSEREALAIAQEAPDIDLVVAGGYRGSGREGGVPIHTALFRGAHLISVPAGGDNLGRAVVTMVRREEGWRVLAVTPDLVPVRGTALDPETAAEVAAAEAAYGEATSRRVGSFAAEGAESQGRIIAALMRRHTRSEIGILNLGGLGSVAGGRSLMLRELNQLLPYDEALVRMTLTGRQLRSLVGRMKRSSANARLLFSGLDLETMENRGRPIDDGEDYSVVTVEFLAFGGDGYVEFTQGTQMTRTPISLRSLVASGLEAWDSLSLDAVENWDRGGVWRSGWRVEGTFNRNYVDSTTHVYRARRERVSFLSGETSIAWTGSMRYLLGYDAGRHIWLLENLSEFGQLGRSFSDLEESRDALELDATWRYRTRGIKIDPFVSSGLSTAFTRSDGKRPKLLRTSAGLQRQFTRRLSGRLGARAQRDITANETDAGAELTLEYSKRVKSDARLSSRVKSFLGFTDRRVVSIENYNTLSLPLVGELALSIRQSNFIYRVNKIGGVPVEGTAFRSDLTVGFAYGRDWKWF